MEHLNKSAFFQAAETGDLSALTSALESNINIESKAQTFSNSPALVLAASKGKTDACRLLLSRKANIEGKDSGLRTALIAAAERGHCCTVDLLLSEGCDLSARTAPFPIAHADGYTAMTAALSWNHRGVVDLLSLAMLTRGADISDLPPIAFSLPLVRRELFWRSRCAYVALITGCLEADGPYAKYLFNDMVAREICCFLG